MKKKVLLLGASGNVASGFVQEYLKNYRKNYDLILGVHRKKEKGELKTIKVDLADLKSLKKAMSGVSVVVNLAANPKPSADFKDLIKPNLLGAYNVFEAARQKKCKRVIFASSVHAIKGYPDEKFIRDGDAPKPSNFYGATKVFGEALCNVFSLKYNLSCFAIRIGAYISDDQRKVVCYTRKSFDYVISQRDMGQLIHKAIVAPLKTKYGILAGISNNKKKKFDLKCTRKLVGYKPKDDSFKLCNVVDRHLKKR